jgi:hypothetical protein
MSQTASFEPKPALAPRSFTPIARPVVQRKCACGGTAGADGECENCKRNRQLVQRRGSDSAAAPAHAPESVHRTLSSPGRPLDTGTRNFMESRFGHDFSRVRVHTDSQAGDSAREINAHAYTAGNDIAFAPGKYQPESHSGRHLLAHELAHTVQQSGLQRRASDLAVDTAPDSQLEHEAESAAHSVSSGSGSPGIASRPVGLTIARVPASASAPPATRVHAAKLKEAGYEEMDPPPKNFADARRFKVLAPFPLPGEKGPVAEKKWKERADGGGLEAIIDSSGIARLKQATFSTDQKRAAWLAKLGWSTGNAPKNWKAADGDSASFDPPTAGGKTCDFDHIVELQVGGTNVTENFQVLDPSENRSSGGTIRGVLRDSAAKLRVAVPDLALKEVVLHWDAVKQVEAAICKDCCAVEKKAAKATTIDPKGSSQGVAVIEKQDISAGGFRSQILVTSEYSNKKLPVPIENSNLAENISAATIVPGLVLVELDRKISKRKIKAKLDDPAKTRLPITLDAETPAFDVKVASDGALSLPKDLKGSGLGFTYKYLSRGSITSLSLNAQGALEWAGEIRPTAKFLPTLDVIYKDGMLRLVAQIPEEKLKKRKLFGATVTKASLEVTLSPNFDVSGNIDFVFGSPKDPAAVGNLKLGKDDEGIVGTAKLTLRIPKVDTTEITFEYKGGAHREEWSGELKIETAQIRIPYVTASSIVARVSSKNGVTDLTFDGKVSLKLPNKLGTAEARLKRWGDNWMFAGGAHLDLPKVENFSAWIEYNIEKETLTASVPDEDGKSPARPIRFTITEDFKGTLDRLKIRVAKGGAVIVTGGGGFDFKKGKAAGKVHVQIAEDGSFNGTGKLTYAITDNMTVDGTVEFKEKGKPKLRITSSLTFKSLELMRAIHGYRVLFEKDFSIPIPYASIGGVGLNAFFGVKLEAGYSLGPVVVEPLIFSAGFNPMDDEPQLDLGVTGELKVPCSATLSASLSGGVKIDAYIAEVGGKITITGTIKLQGGLFVPFKGNYSNKEFAVEMTPEAKLKLLLGVMLSATVWAKAGIGFLSVRTEKTWVLAQREIDTRLGFGIKAPISYSSRTGPKIPTLDQIQFVPPDFSKENLLRIADQLFSGARGEPADA